jgi:Glu-tRNA(Gln) amidotransferase subunit E-like FAD-binding protein
MPSDEHDDTLIRERFAELPQAVQQAVVDASVEQKLRALASKYKLHLDQWVLLENEIMLTLLGLEEPENMVANVAKEVHIDTERAQKIVNDIALEVFKPIREQMQGELNSEAMRRKKVPAGGTTADTGVPVAKAAPSDTTSYKPGESSTERRDVQEDPYRESID